MRDNRRKMATVRGGTVRLGRWQEASSCPTSVRRFASNGGHRRACLIAGGNDGRGRGGENRRGRGNRCRCGAGRGASGANTGGIRGAVRSLCHAGPSIRSDAVGGGRRGGGRCRCRDDGVGGPGYRSIQPKQLITRGVVYGIARRRVLLELRKRKRRKSVPREAQVSVDVIGDVGDGVDVAEGVAARLDARRKVDALRGSLTGVDFEVLVLSCVEELSAREVGQVIRRSERAVHSILHRAKKKARERLVGDGRQTR